MMLYKNRNEKICVRVVTGCLILAAVWAVLAMPETALAKRPPGEGGGGEVGQEIPVYISFDETGCIRSDDTKNLVYIDGELKGKVTAIVGRNFSILLETNNSNKITAGRTLWLDLGDALTCAGSVSVDVSDGAGGDVDGICDTCVPGVPDLPLNRFGTLTPGQKSGYPDSAKLRIWGRDLDGLPAGLKVDTCAWMEFSVDGQGWVLYWGSYQVPGGWTYAPGTSPVTVERVDNDIWRITCAGDACLYRVNNPPHRPTEYHGQVNVPFGMTVEAITHEETIWGDEPWGIIGGAGSCVSP